MKITEENIKVQKTARYLIIGNKDVPPNSLVFALHGYGMSVKQFAEPFLRAHRPDTWTIIPEGLSRFYRKGFSGDVVASWMTREARLDDISDYISYLDMLLNTLVPAGSIPVYVIGFSQGASTASRWAMMGRRQPDNLVLWGGEFAPDIAGLPSGLCDITHVIASDDEFITAEQSKSQTQKLRDKGFIVNEVHYKGKHEIDLDTLNNVLDILLK